MINLSKLNIDNLMDVCAVANSSMYIYKHLSMDFSVQHLAKQGAKNILKAANEILKGEEIHLEQTTTAYALLVALDFVDMYSLNEALQEQPVPPLRWADEILNIIRGSKVGFRSETILKASKPVLASPQPSFVVGNQSVQVVNASPNLIQSDPLIKVPCSTTIYEG